jgi:16S rRNA (uracil1498-N3)-methyltransferase
MRVLIQRGSGAAGRRVSLDQEEIHHLKVRRAADGARVEALDGSGFRGNGTLVQFGRKWEVEIGAAELEQPPAPLTLAVAAGDRDRFSWMVEKAAELGVTSIVPLETSRTTGVASRLRSSHIERLRRSALEAIKQCGAAWATRIEDPVSLVAFTAEPVNGAGWLADQAGDPPPASVDQSAVTVVIGPEGGLADDERESLVAAGYRPMALGTHTLRFETAALAAAAAVTQARMRGSHA